MIYGKLGESRATRLFFNHPKCSPIQLFVRFNAQLFKRKKQRKNLDYFAPPTTGDFLMITLLKVAPWAKIRSSGYAGKNDNQYSAHFNTYIKQRTL
jgi:hypothetical protein